MTILLYKNGQWLIDGEQPLEGVSLDNLAAILTNPADGDVIKYDESSGMWTAGKALPDVTATDNGKVLTVKDGAWAADANAYIINVSNNVADSSADEIHVLASAGFVPVLKSDGNYFVYTHTSGRAYFIRTYYSNSKFSYQYASVASNKNVEKGGAIVLYSKPSDGIPETDLAQAVKDKLNKFVVTLTPTAADFSGTMDKTVAEINAAYEAGQEIVFKLQTSASSYIEVPVQLVGHETTLAYPSFETSVVQGVANVQVFAYTSATDDGTKATYATKVYSLTPAS